MTNQTYGILQAVGTFAGIGVIGYWSKQMFVNGDLAPFEENTLGGKVDGVCVLSLWKVVQKEYFDTSR